MIKKKFLNKEIKQTMNDLYVWYEKNSDWESYRSEIRKIMNDEEFFLLKWDSTKAMKFIKKPRMKEIIDQLNYWFWNCYTAK